MVLLRGSFLSPLSCAAVLLSVSVYQCHAQGPTEFDLASGNANILVLFSLGQSSGKGSWKGGEVQGYVSVHFPSLASKLMWVYAMQRAYITSNYFYCRFLDATLVEMWRCIHDAIYGL